MLSAALWVWLNCRPAVFVSLLGDSSYILRVWLYHRLNVFVQFWTSSKVSQALAGLFEHHSSLWLLLIDRRVRWDVRGNPPPPQSSLVRVFVTLSLPPLSSESSRQFSLISASVALVSFHDVHFISNGDPIGILSASGVDSPIDAICSHTSASALSQNQYAHISTFKTWSRPPNMVDGYGNLWGILAARSDGCALLLSSPLRGASRGGGNSSKLGMLSLQEDLLHQITPHQACPFS
ncbi:hypothetical protein EDB85DRAFT_1894197 [Lactarius pseudohatsudake]|nr:hypothetical protein EDB85DRAFT_1894197 [Lactarius pseudohatsudake]